MSEIPVYQWGVAGWRAPKAREWRRRRRREGWGRLGSLGERRELPQRGPGRSPGRNAFLAYFRVTEASSRKKNAHILPHIFSETTTY